MAQASRTYNPLHFEDLEPKRFEDLVRQLIYDFRDWRQLEATGRSGSDDGFDARGWEIHVTEKTEPSEDEGGEAVEAVSEDRIWLLQCKREKSITPKKLGDYLDGIFANGEKLYGLIFAAPCEFSKQSKDLFRQKCADHGISEAYLWGKAELEDMLFQPKNDHLLFAYFGFSLTIRQRSHKTRINAMLTMKRRARKHLASASEVLIRDVNDTHYPYSGDVPDFSKKHPWRVFRFNEFTHDGVEFIARWHYAYVSPDRSGWDYIKEATIYGVNDPWREKTELSWEEIRKYEAFWSKLERGSQAHFEIRAVIKYENIIAIDELGDENLYGTPHLYAAFEDDIGPFDYTYATLKVLGHGFADVNPDPEKQIEFFPKIFPEPEPLVIE